MPSRAWRMKLVIRQRAAWTVSALRIQRSFSLIRHAIAVNRSVASSSASAAACLVVSLPSAALSTAQGSALGSPFLDGGRLFVEARFHPIEQVGQRPFADGQAEDIPEQGGEPLETFENHLHRILERWTSTHTNARLEGLNGLFQAARARARGYRNTTTFMTMIYLIAAPVGNLFDSAWNVVEPLMYDIL